MLGREPASTLSPSRVDWRVHRPDASHFIGTPVMIPHSNSTCKTPAVRNGQSHGRAKENPAGMRLCARRQDHLSRPDSTGHMGERKSSAGDSIPPAVRPNPCHATDWACPRPKAARRGTGRISQTLNHSVGCPLPSLRGQTPRRGRRQQLESTPSTSSTRRSRPTVVEHYHHGAF
jgi:hypothetical protein